MPLRRASCQARTVERPGGSSRAVVSLTLAYVAGAFGWRTWRQWKTTGDTGIRVGRDGSVEERVAGGLFAASVVAGLVATAQSPRGRRSVRRVGLGLMATGLAGTLLSQLDLGRSWRIGVDPSERTDLVTDGAFAIVRNPIFSAMATFAIGAALAIGTRTARLAAVAMVAAVEAQVRLVEEPYLADVHGERYREYRGRVGRFVPRLG
jgi:protein-S-isoprenylcysteine O-methyltransferase Ste14